MSQMRDESGSSSSLIAVPGQSQTLYNISIGRMRLIKLLFYFNTLVFQLQSVSSFTHSLRRHSDQGVMLSPKHLFPTISGANTRHRTSFQAISNNDEVSLDETLQHGQLALAKFYHGLSFFYCGQVLLAMKTYGLTLESLNFVGEPFMAAGISHLLGESSRNKYLGLDTFKRLNGLLFLYALIRLGISALMRNVFEPDGMLWLLGSASTIFIVTRGYLSGLLADGGKSFLPETFRLLKAAASLTSSLPPKKMTYPNFIRLVTVAIRKTAFLGGILNLLWLGDATRLQIAPKVIQLAKLTLLGGSLVTSISVEHNKRAKRATTGPVNIMALYVFSSMSAFSLVKASNPLELADGILLGICAVCSASEGFYQSKKQQQYSEPKEHSG